MVAKQIQQMDIFGGALSYDTVPGNKSKPRKLKTMQQKYGVHPQHTCSECKYLLKILWERRTYYKCRMWHVSKCRSTDVKKNGAGCMKFEYRDTFGIATVNM